MSCPSKGAADSSRPRQEDARRGELQDRPRAGRHGEARGPRGARRDRDPVEGLSAQRSRVALRPRLPLFDSS